MLKRNLVPFAAIFLKDLSPPFNYFHTAARSTSKESFYFPCTEELLASHLAPLLQIKDRSFSAHVLQQVQQIHAQITVNGLHDMGVLGTRILGMYIICNKYFDAKKLFFQLQLCYASPWNWMMRGFVVLGYFDSAILFYFKMLAFGTFPDKYTFPLVIKACGGLHSVDLVKHIHGMIKKLGFEYDVYVGSALVKFYAENDYLGIARELFDKLTKKDIVLWNTMLNGYLKYEDLMHNVMSLFEEMRKSEVKPNSVTYACVLSVCGSKSIVGLGAQIHGLIIRCGLEMESPVANTVISMYAKCRCLFDAKKLFDSIMEVGLVTWNGMIGGYVQNGFMSEALVLFWKMVSSAVKPDSRTFATLLPAISEMGCFSQGKEIHCYIIRHGLLLDLFLKNALIDLYFKCKDVDRACNVFDQSSAVDIVVCTAMISGFVLNGMNIDALGIFRWLLQKQLRPNAVTLASILPACAGIAGLKLGMELHGNIIRKGLEGRCYVGSAITNMYSKCGRLNLAHLVFTRMPERDSICWNSMITSCSQNGKPEVAINLFRRMAIEGAKYDNVTISAVLSACANLSALHFGKQIHGFIIRGTFISDIFADSALIDLYAKCGDLDLAQRIFDVMESKNEVSWNSIIAAYGNHGHIKQCLTLFHGMVAKGFHPDHVTFLAIISAFGHAGQVEEGKHYFDLMTLDYGISPWMEHYACLIDILARSGRVEEASRLIEDMPFPPDAGIWGTLLGACRVHGNIKLAEMASEHLLHLDPQNSGYYVLLSNLHADSGKWERVSQIRDLMKERGVKKMPGYSWIEVNNSSHMFAAADKSHPQSCQIYLLLKYLLLELQNEVYINQNYSV